MSRKKRKYKVKKGLSFITCIVVVFCICVGVKVHTLKKQQSNLLEKKEILEKQIKSEEERKEELENLEKYMQTKKYMEDIAREKLGLVYPDEILIQPE